MGILVMFAVGGMYGGVAQTLHMMLPAVSVDVWVVLLLIVTLAVLLTGSYGQIEFVATFFGRHFYHTHRRHRGVIAGSSGVFHME